MRLLWMAVCWVLSWPAVILLRLIAELSEGEFTLLLDVGMERRGFPSVRFERRHPLAGQPWRPRG